MTSTVSPISSAQAPDSQDQLDSLIEADSLVEEVSIDGMCGVY
jgi:mycofactocin precursor